MESSPHYSHCCFARCRLSIPTSGSGVIAELGTVALIANIAMVAAGSMLLMWLGELVTEFGIGNGVSPCHSCGYSRKRTDEYLADALCCDRG